MIDLRLIRKALDNLWRGVRMFTDKELEFAIDLMIKNEDLMSGI